MMGSMKTSTLEAL
ncbi:hypothetical protein AKOMA_94 [Mycobacterium phage Akoma]|nr:hypothetical protein CM10_gp094 [Mycobacterium phage Akoma]AER48904.1 hypothetical protein AKOMA_94 [Mycobacterium phage Akoma]